MTSKQVLDKILTLLSSKKEEVIFAYAKLADGTILESPTFDVGEPIEIVSEDGKTPAPDGEHEIALKDTEGKDVIIRVQVKDGKIESRENVEETNPQAKETPESEIKKEVAAAAETVEAHPLPMTTDEDPRNTITDDSEETEKDPLITLSYRIDELEKAMEEMKQKFALEPAPKAEDKKEADVELERELPKLNGAPIEETKFSTMKTEKIQNKNKVENAQNSFLSKLYN
jgi:hypothetical protein